MNSINLETIDIVDLLSFQDMTPLSKGNVMQLIVEPVPKREFNSILNEANKKFNERSND